MSQNLFIPKKLRIGFNNRSDTFTGKLAYIIYYDEKGKLRKEKSWESWRNSKIDPVEIDNTPTAAFILNKGIQRIGYDWGTGRSVIRVHHPNDFEFEISVDNLIGILMHSDISKRDIAEECVFAWHGTELVLLPVNSEDYKSAVQYTENQDKKISAKELQLGHTYRTKKGDVDTDYIYIGRHKFREISYYWSESELKNKHVFFNMKNKKYEAIDAPRLSHVSSTYISDDFSNIVENFIKSRQHQNVKTIVPSNITEMNFDDSNTTKIDYLYKELEEGIFIKYRIYRNSNFKGQRYCNDSELIGLHHLGVLKANLIQKNINDTFQLLKNDYCFLERQTSYWNNSRYFELKPLGIIADIKNNYDLTAEEVFDILVNEGFSRLDYILEDGTIETIKG